MDELMDMIEKALSEGEPLHVRFVSGGREWVLSMSPHEEVQS